MNRLMKLYGLLAVCIFLFIGLGLALARPGLPDYAPYLSFSPDRDGAKAIRLLMEREAGAVREWRLAPERLPEGEGQLFISIEPYGVLRESEAALREWAAQGNEVVVFDASANAIEGLGLAFAEEPEGPEEASVITAALPDGGTATFRAAVGTELRLTVEDASEAAVVVQRDAAGALAVREAVGEGRVTVAVTGDWLMNENVLEDQRFELLWLLLGGDSLAGRTVFFDEYHHGYSVSPGLTRVYPMWLLAGLGQAALALAAWLWWRGKRFGPAYTPRAFLVRRGDETLMAVAGWYRRGRLSFEALDFAVERLRLALQTRGGAPASAGAGQLAAAVERALEGRRPAPARLRDVLERWEALRRAKAGGDRLDYDEKAWTADAAVLDETMKTLEEEP